MKFDLRSFSEVWLADFEFIAPDGCRPTPVCLVAHEYRSGKHLRFWQDELLHLPESPFSTDSSSLFVAYYASAEMNCFLSLNWRLPARVLDLYAEFRAVTNGSWLPSGKGLIGALVYYGLDSIGIAEKKDMRDLIMRGGPWSDAEKKEILHYCEGDVTRLAQLLHRMEDVLTSHALVRGQYMKAVARMEHNGIPLDTALLAQLENRWPELKASFVTELGGQYGVYEGTTFKVDRFARWLGDRGIPWPHLPSGRLDLSDDTFKDMSRAYPELRPLHELRHTLSQLRLSKLTVGSDGRNRCLLSPFGSKTGRNQPSTTHFIFGPSTWIRSLIMPAAGMALVYIDWSQQEFGIAAALSQDPNMLEAYVSGDPYMSFAKLAKAVPAGATKHSHPQEREVFKQVLLAVNYCMGPKSLSYRLACSEARAKELLSIHKRTFPTFWSWSDSAVNYAMLNNQIYSRLGWTMKVDSRTKERTLRNFPMQANGAEMLRLACCYATERGVRICAPVHDALLLECRIEELEQAIRCVTRAMGEASATILDGLELATEYSVVKYPERYSDKRGERMWRVVMQAVQAAVAPQSAMTCFCEPKTEVIAADMQQHRSSFATRMEH